MRAPTYQPAEEEVPGLLPSLLRMIRPGLTVAVLLAGYTGMVLGKGGFPACGVTLGTIVALGMTSSGAVILNGVIERESDAGMRRLRRRVAALRRIGVVPSLMIAAMLVVGGLAVAWLSANGLTALLIATAVVCYVLFYTLFLKRLTHGTVPGGIPGALPVLAGYAAVRGTLGLDALFLFLILFLWQPPHFWLLTLRHEDDYRQAGILVPATTHGARYAGLLIRTYLAALLPATLSLWLFGFCSWRYAVVAVAAWLPFAVTAWRPDHGKRAVTAFRLSIVYLTVLCSAIILDRGLYLR